MPYCTKCDMEFIEGIITCSDCGEPLADSKAAAEAREQEARSEQEYEAFLQEQDKMQLLHKPSAKTAGNGVYVNKTQKYEDLKSSASAFLIVGILLTGITVLSFIGILQLPVSGTASTIIMQTLLSLMSFASIAVFIHSSHSAKKIGSHISGENEQSQKLIDWFLANHTAEQLDKELNAEISTLAPEELSLKRFELILDHLITQNDLPDQAYADFLTEEIYDRLFD